MHHLFLSIYILGILNIVLVKKKKKKEEKEEEIPNRCLSTYLVIKASEYI